MRIAIRTELGGRHGFGHGRRMLGLAHVLSRQGAEVTFLCAETPERAFTPYPVSRLVSGVEWCQQAVAWTMTQPDVVLVDLKHDWPPSVWPLLRERSRVVRIDHPYAEPDSCDLLVLPNAHQDPAVVEGLSLAFEGRLLCGAPYALLDPDLRRWVVLGSAYPSPRIALVAGGTDPMGALQQMLDMSEGLPARLPEVSWVFLLGQGQVAPVTVHGLAANQALMGFSPGLLATADLWVGLFGVMPYQAMALGIPMLTVGHTAENAEGSARLMTLTGATVDLGYLPTLRREEWRQEILALWGDPAVRKQMGRQGQAIIDGQGAERVAEAILGLGA